MRLKTSLAAVILLAAVGVSFAVGQLVGAVATKAVAPAHERIPVCRCTPETISVGGQHHGA